MLQLPRYRYYPLLMRFGLALSLLSLVGCAEFNSGWNGYSSRYHDSYSQSDFDELLAFGDNMANLPASARTKQCRSLIKRQKNLSRTGIVLHLMVGRLLSDGCGDISKILSELRSLPPGSLDARTQKLVAIDTEALRRMSSSPRKTVSADCKQKAGQFEVEPRSIKGSGKNETRLLREKLDAIRTMEKQMDESGDTQ